MLWSEGGRHSAVWAAAPDAVALPSGAGRISKIRAPEAAPRCASPSGDEPDAEPALRDVPSPCPDERQIPALTGAAIGAIENGDRDGFVVSMLITKSAHETTDLHT